MPKRLLTCFLDLLLVPAPEQAGDGGDAGHRALVADPLLDQPYEIRVHKLVPQFDAMVAVCRCHYANVISYSHGMEWGQHRALSSSLKLEPYADLFLALGIAREHIYCVCKVV